MLSWDVFLESIADKEGLVDADERTVFLTRFAEKHLKTRVTNATIADKLGISQSDLERKLGKVYTILETSCPELKPATKGKIKILHSFLTQEYSKYQKQEQIPSQ
ncbi:MAG: hypothetical protein ACKPFF_38555, partial [Planktothrix sp.]